ncbi:MAG TPA: hypothetical protein VN372_05250 [Methanospirillum sp.]|nr:hypothetical protein [Methanospirillum sp.]
MSKNTNIIAEFNDHSGIINQGCGYQDISSFRVEDLREMLNNFKDGTEIRIAALPHQDGGNAILMKPRLTEEPHWVFLCPVLGRENNRHPVPIYRKEQ